MQRKKMEGVSGGLARVAAESVLGDVNSSVIAGGSTQADAVALNASVNVVTEAAAGSGVALNFYADVSDETLVANLGDNAVLVYPPLGGAIQDGAADAGFSVAVGKTAVFKKVSTSLYIAMVG